MQRFRFPIAVAVTSLALVAALIGAGGLLVGNALAIGPFSGGGRGPGAAMGAGWQNAAIPPELAGLMSVPAGERFAHFRGVRIQLTDKDNAPLSVEITPGTATAVSSTSLTVSANDGSTHTFALDGKTIVHGKSADGNAPQAATSTIAANAKVVVATLNGSTTATVVMAVGADGFGSHGPWGR